MRYDTCRQDGSSGASTRYPPRLYRNLVRFVLRDFFYSPLTVSLFSIRFVRPLFRSLGALCLSVLSPLLFCCSLSAPSALPVLGSPGSSLPASAWTASSLSFSSHFLLQAITQALQPISPRSWLCSLTYKFSKFASVYLQTRRIDCFKIVHRVSFCR